MACAWIPSLLLLFSAAAAAAPPASPASDEACAADRLVRADLEAWKKAVAKKDATQARLAELFSQLKLRTGTARELPDVEQGDAGRRQLEIQGIEDFKARLTGAARPESVVQVRYILKVGKSCGEHEDHCFEGYAVQALRPLGRNRWCALGADLSTEVWGPERDYTFCVDARNQSRELSSFALTAPGRKAIRVDDFRAHCPSNGNRSRSHERAFWEARAGSLVEIFRITLDSQSGGPDLGRLTTVKARLAYSGDFPKLIHYELSEEECGAGVFSDDPSAQKKACRKSERFQVFQYRDGRYAPE